VWDIDKMGLLVKPSIEYEHEYLDMIDD